MVVRIIDFRVSSVSYIFWSFALLNFLYVHLVCVPNSAFMFCMPILVWFGLPFCHLDFLCSVSVWFISYFQLKPNCEWLFVRVFSFKYLNRFLLTVNVPKIARNILTDISISNIVDLTIEWQLYYCNQILWKHWISIAKELILEKNMIQMTKQKKLDSRRIVYGKKWIFFTVLFFLLLFFSIAN